ncbi:hypothetical protein PUR59_30580 [Streptomyces sp. SP18ES09]|uniref:hypothetical protein n=1 Tax=Streptomyces sp. SP18ES09 TaxID=3002532 RepID=UPI002E7A0CD6|nr:hypothetical protein [Streptomyces sp. SP18ES09]MEE1819348.1 hypothetical protein [Streptomyces sp. SP18ES09]
MTGYLICPAPRCDHTVSHVSKLAAANDMASHLVKVHQLPEVSARYQADLLLPITGPRAVA